MNDFMLVRRAGPSIDDARGHDNHTLAFSPDTPAVRDLPLKRSYR